MCRDIVGIDSRLLLLLLLLRYHTIFIDTRTPLKPEGRWSDLPQTYKNHPREPHSNRRRGEA